MKIVEFENVSSDDVWNERVIDLEKQKVEGAVFYTDGGYKRSFPIPNTSWAIHSYFYNNSKPKNTSLIKLSLPTVDGYFNEPKGSVTIVNVLKIYNKSALISDPETTNNRAELMGVINALQTVSKTRLKDILKKVTIISDSEYVVVHGVLHAKKWKANGWRKSSGGEVPNSDLFEIFLKEIDVLSDCGIDLSFKHVKGHSDEYGNTQADNLCNLAIINRIEMDQFESMPFLLDTKVDMHPFMLDQRYLHFPLTTVDNIDRDKGFYDNLVFMFSCGKQNFEIADLGCRLNDLTIAILDIPEDETFIEMAKTIHRTCLKLEDVVESVPIVVDPKNLLTNRFKHILDNDLIASISKKETINHVSIQDPFSIDSIDKTVASVISPPRNSFKLLDEYLKAIYRLEDSYKDGQQLVCKTDVTDLFYGTKTVKEKEVKYFLLDSAQTVDTVVEHWVNGEIKESVVTLTIGLDTPKRRTFFNLVDLEPKINVVTWEYTNDSFRFGLLIETSNGKGFWLSPYSNVQLLY